VRLALKPTVDGILTKWWSQSLDGECICGALLTGFVTKKYGFVSDDKLVTDDLRSYRAGTRRQRASR
jgi:hypothetical protein